MREDVCINNYIYRLANRICSEYPSTCADKDDYVQIGYLTLTSIKKGNYKKDNFNAYAIISIARAMRCEALKNMGAVHAPIHLKRISHKIRKLSYNDNSEDDICNELEISCDQLLSLKPLCNKLSLEKMLYQPSFTYHQFSIFEDILSCCFLNKKDKVLLQSYFDGDIDSDTITRKQKWTQMKKIRYKLVKSGYYE